MSYGAIRKALDTALDGFSEAQGVPVAWPNFDYDPPDKYLRSFMLTAEPEAATLGPNGEDRLTGVLQIDVVGPRNEGTQDSYAVVDALMAHFSRGTDLTADGQVVTIERAWPGPALTDEGDYFIPVSVSWFSYA